jgi:cell division initiation protein
MLTPVDLQQKKFKIGLGYDKNDVQSFFEEVSQSYVELYRANADLKDQLITLTDTVQHYKAQEDNLQKSLLLAEKNSEESKTAAEKAAKTIEMEARNRANDIVRDAKEELEVMKTEMAKLQSMYAEYKIKFAALLRKSMEELKKMDFDPNAAVPKNPEPEQPSRGNMMDDFQGLGGGGGGINSSRDERRSNSSNVYGSTLGGEGINPFKIKR